MSALPEQHLPLQDYFTLEETGDVKHEFLRGAIFAMIGAGWQHNLITANIISELRPQLRGKPCKVFSGDLRVKIEATGLYTYPDVQVICDNMRFADNRTDTVINPTVLIEVLSPGTENYDRGNKFLHYRTIETLQAYLVVAQDTPRVELHIRQDAHQWLLSEITREADPIPLKAIGCTLTMPAIYEDLVFAAE
jgi:Uma2 family endonuclease